MLPTDRMTAHLTEDVRSERERLTLGDDMSEIGVLAEAMKISPLNGPNDWPIWNRKLKGYLSAIGWWKILTGETPQPNIQDDERYQTWLDK